MYLDSIKSRARHASWRSDGESKWDKYNIFYRKPSRASTRDLGDEESQNAPRPHATKLHSTGCIDTNNNTESFPPPAHANTYQGSGSPTSSTDTKVEGGMNGSAKDYYNNVDGNTSQPAPVNGEVDGIARLRSKTGTGLSPVKENTESPNEKNTFGEEEDVEERKKREHVERMKRKIPAMQQVKTVLFPQWLTINWLLFMAPIGIGLNYAGVEPLAIFVVNFIAIIPLAGILSFATEEIALRVGEVLGGLLNASFGYVERP
jgi:Ca2+:H+ antiporter